MMIDDESAWAAALRRDRRFDGQFVSGVFSTGIYCRPSCPARHPKRENVGFFPDGAAARAAGLRPCKRCLPDDVARDRKAIDEAIKLLSGDDPPRLEALAQQVGYAPHHFQRLFKRDIGISPAHYVRQIRAKRAQVALEGTGRVTDAIYAAGYSGPSRFYADAKKHMGMAPKSWRNGGAGSVINWSVVETTLGPMLVAATQKGVCCLSFDEGEADLRRRFPNAMLREGDDDFEQLVRDVIAVVEAPGKGTTIPLDVQGTAFQESVWRELQNIPPGETRTYAQIAASVGKPRAVRAAGTANGQNRVAVLIPCHRVIRTDGSLGGYAYGLDRKAELLKREKAG